MSKKPKQRSEIENKDYKSKSSMTRDFGNEKPIWKFEIFDVGLGWNEEISQDYLLTTILTRIKSFESMTWNEILIRDKKANHSIPLGSIIPQARKRLQIIKQDDIDKLISLRVGATERIWGIKELNVFKILWWDPEHKICPCLLKHT